MAKVPHMGWNDLVDPHGPDLIAAIGASPMYFTHSFAFWPDDRADVAAEADHGGRFPAAVVRAWRRSWIMRWSATSRWPA